MSDNNAFSGDMDPEIAELMGIDLSKPSGRPGFNDLFGAPASELSEEQADLGKQTFPQLTKFEDTPKNYFEDKDFYKKAIANCGEASTKLHELLSKFIAAKDVQNKAAYRNKLIPAYWNLLEALLPKIISDKSQPRSLMLRFGLVHPGLLTPEQRSLIAKIIFENPYDEPVYYLDEWLQNVARGKIAVSMTDEIKTRPSDGQKTFEKMERAKGQRSSYINLLRTKIAALESQEFTVKASVESLLAYDTRPEFDNLRDEYNSIQKKALKDLINAAGNLMNIDKEMSKIYADLKEVSGELNNLNEKAADAPEIMAVGQNEILQEFNSVKQMIKLCVGRQGNHFPILYNQYFRASLLDTATRENVISELSKIEALDPGIFRRTFKQQTNRIVPYIVIVPCYGDYGICWEPFSKFNRATGRGRIAIPLFPKDTKTAILNAAADLRWQVAKEKAQHYWMEEGITGKYYQWFSEKKMKGDVKELFIQDYILWITKESEGTQKLDKEVRGIFWRNMPFPQDVKDKLKNRGFVYNELYKKDQNIARSDGY